MVVMNIFIDDKANDKLKAKLDKRSSPSAIEVIVTNNTWCGVTLGLSLEGQREDKEYMDINGIKISVETQLKKHNKDIIIYVQKILFWEMLNVAFKDN